MVAMVSLFLHFAELWRNIVPLGSFFNEQRMQLIVIFLTLCVGFWLERASRKLIDWLLGTKEPGRLHKDQQT